MSGSGNAGGSVQLAGFGARGNSVASKKSKGLGGARRLGAGQKVTLDLGVHDVPTEEETLAEVAKQKAENEALAKRMSEAATAAERQRIEEEEKRAARSRLAFFEDELEPKKATPKVPTPEYGGYGYGGRMGGGSTWMSGPMPATPKPETIGPTASDPRFASKKGFGSDAMNGGDDGLYNSAQQRYGSGATAIGSDAFFGRERADSRDIHDTAADLADMGRAAGNAARNMMSGLKNGLEDMWAEHSAGRRR